MLEGETDIPKKNKIICAKLIANPGEGDVSEAASKIEQVTRHVMDAGLKVDVALVKPKLPEPVCPAFH